eukprot:Blabericola_migrator_1__6694@NODE_3386_length_1815_cov_176_816934_g2109_i0_p1_GENE_NODE_3386_length_1815_cov_176_816934_g2109_i0NODE_3386_length_1815_cov_176_816934_g2109_i0_p1_ORF_typecomplete_len217_score28_85Alba/PF01918_21/0_00018Rpp20/PF12328_8/0_017Rpp20/PF12328_8/1_1e04_NODE_3386_length_1815_cov_176_816934_g2109_i09381588
MSTQPAKAVDQPTAVPPAANQPAADEDPTIGRIQVRIFSRPTHPKYDTTFLQVSAQRRRRFYVFVARRQFASRPECERVVITALGSAIAAAISTAGELQETSVATIEKVETFYAPIHPGGNRNVSRIAITLKRNPEWKVGRDGRRGSVLQSLYISPLQPDESDTQRPRQRKEQPATEEKKTEGGAAPAPTAAAAAPAASSVAPAAAAAEGGQPKAQ